MPKSRTAAPLIERLYARFLTTERSADFIYEVSRHYSLASLERLLRVGSPFSRRGAALAIGFVGDYSLNPALGKSLRDRDRAVRLLADHGIRQLWMRVGDPLIESALRRMSRLVQRERFDEVLEIGDSIAEHAPETAEVWNQRALAWSGLEEFGRAVDESWKALELNPWHFHAAMVAANCQLELGNIVEAIRGFHVALEINPDLEIVRGQVRRLEKILEGR